MKHSNLHTEMTGLAGALQISDDAFQERDTLFCVVRLAAKLVGVVGAIVSVVVGLKLFRVASRHDRGR